MRFFALFLILGLWNAFPASLSAQLHPGLPSRLQVVVDGHKLPQESFGFLVQEVGASTSLLEANAAVAFNPASTMKVVTTLAALEQLGPDFNWTTRLYALGSVEDGTLNGDLLVQGGGDPYLLEDQVRNMLKALQRQGITRITGDLVLDTNYFDASVSQDALIDTQDDRAYNVLPNALMSNFQAVTFYFRPTADGSHVEITADPALGNLRIDNRLTIKQGACEGYQRGIRFDDAAANPERVVLSGAFPSGCREFALVRAVMTPETFFFGLFTKLWNELGGEFSGALRAGVYPADQKPVLQWDSPPLAEVIRSINKFSNNVMTRQTLLTLGAEQDQMPATIANGQAVINSYLANLGIATAGMELANGSGLARESRISPVQMTQVLQHGYRSRFMAEFIASLPINGIDGTMRNRLRADNLWGTMHIKTGSLDEVTAVAGYVTARSGKQYTVVGVLNHALADQGPGVELMDALLTWVHEQ